jgi:hypothetical protein
MSCRTEARIISRWARVRIWLPLLSGACLTAVALAGTATGTPAAASPAAHAARTCSPPKYPGLGYFTSLTVTGVSCATGSKVAIAYYHCRTSHGAAGRCHGGVLGYKCSEQRNSIPTEIDGRVTCRRGHATVTHTFQQNT